MLEPPESTADFAASHTGLKWFHDVWATLTGRLNRQSTINALTAAARSPLKGKFFIMTPTGDAAFTGDIYFDTSRNIFVPASFTVAATLTANKRVIANVGAFRVWKSAAQSIATATATTVTFDTAIFDEDAGVNLTTGVFTCVQPGKYAVSAATNFGTTTNNCRIGISIQKNGTDRATNWSKNGVAVDVLGVVVSDTIELAVGDTLNVQVFQNTGVNQNLANVVNGTFFSGAKVD